MDIKVSYVTSLPKVYGSPKIVVSNLGDGDYFMVINDLIIDNLVDGEYINNKQWVGDYIIEIYKDGSLVYSDIFNLKHKTSFIKLDSYALGDTLAWISYVEEFRVKHGCNVICSTFHNDLIKDYYPNILFVQPNLTIHNVYHQVYIGASDDDNYIYSPVNSKQVRLQRVASSILGLEDKELRPNIGFDVLPYKHTKKYVCISEFASGVNKMWKDPNGWQNIVNFLVLSGYDVIVISKEKTSLNNVIDLSGDYPLFERISILKGSNFFMGVSSALSWLSWSVGVHTVLISDVTPIDHEFTTNVTRISKNTDLKVVNYDISTYTTSDDVINKLKQLINME